MWSSSYHTNSIHAHHYTNHYERLQIQCTCKAIADVKPFSEAGIVALMQ